MTNVDEEVLKKHGAKLSRIKERLNFHLKGSKKKNKTAKEEVRKITQVNKFQLNLRL